MRTIPAPQSLAIQAGKHWKTVNRNSKWEKIVQDFTAGQSYNPAFTTMTVTVTQGPVFVSTKSHFIFCYHF